MHTKITLTKNPELKTLAERNAELENAAGQNNGNVDGTGSGTPIHIQVGAGAAHAGRGNEIIDLQSDVPPAS